MKFFDVDLGNCTYIKTPNGTNVLFDVGSNETFSPIEYIKNRNEDLDYLIISHPHEDHISDLLNMDFTIEPKVLTRNENIPVELIQDRRDNAKNEEDKNKFDKYLDLNNRFNHPVSDEKNPENPKINGGVDFKFFIPNFEEERNDLNDYSLAVLISYSNRKVLLMGDNTLKNIEKMRKNPFWNEIRNVDILLAPHHGRDSCYDVDFVNHVNPSLTIISDESGTNDSASTKYSEKSRGYNVFKNGEYDERSCLTTRKDGMIRVTISNNDLKVIND